MFYVKLNLNMKSREIGKTGEWIAGEYLKKSGYKIIAKNYRIKFDEIDLIGISQKGIMIFFEIKSTSDSGLAKEKRKRPEDNFTSEKRKRVARISEMFYVKHLKNGGLANGFRFDLIAVYLKKEGSFYLNHYKNV